MAVESVTRRIKEMKERGRHSLVVTLDLQNAFNTAWMVEIDRVLDEKGVPGELRNICWDFLCDRQIASGKESMRVEKGCPQGSSLGPTLWLACMEGWFEMLNREGG